MGVTRDAVSTYARQRSLPSPPMLKKMASVLQLPADELLPTRYASQDAIPMAFEVRPDGMVHLYVDMELPMDVGVEIASKLQTYARAAIKGNR